MDKIQKHNRQYKTIWISDVHLGSFSCKADLLADFLKHNDCEKLYLVGDIIDGWRLKKNFYWPQAHNNVVRRILTKAKRDTDVYYIAGNHDEFLRKFMDYNLQIGNIRICNEMVHEAVDGRKILVTHGDMFDIVTRYHRWLAFAGDRAYDTLVHVNSQYNKLRRYLGRPYWSLAAYAKSRVKVAVNFIFEFENALAYECRKRKLDGVVCGHIHHPVIKDIEDVTYYNCGDWEESCSALVEHHDGQMEIIYWHDLLSDTQPDTQESVSRILAA